jgi:hypothetical protein
LRCNQTSSMRMSFTRPLKNGEHPGKGAGAKDGKKTARNSSVALQHFIEGLPPIDGE